MVIRPEREGDEAAIHEVNARAFELDAEARLVDALRAKGAAVVSLVAELEGRVVGHILFSPVTVGSSSFLGLAPMAVLPGFQRKGIGSQLVRAGIEACRALGAKAIFVLGHRHYYPRFGFVPAGPHGLHYVDEEFDPHFLVLELVSGALEGVQGFVQYDAAFDGL